MIKEGVKVKLINLNNLSIDADEKLNLSSEIIGEFNEQFSFFKEKGIMINGLNSIEIRDKTKFYIWIIGRLFPEYYIEDNQYANNGSPDFHLIKMDEKSWNEKSQKRIKKQIMGFNEKHIIESYYEKPNEIWVEVKYNLDKLREEQLTWMIKNKDKKIKILFIKEEDDN